MQGLPTAKQRSELAALAAGSGKLGCLKVLKAHGCAMDLSVWQSAATEGHLDTLRWLQRKVPGWLCGRRGAPSVIKWEWVSSLLRNNIEWSGWVAISAAEAGQLACLRFLIEHGCPSCLLTTAAAAEHGHLDCLMYLHAQGCPWDEGTTTDAAAGGHLDCLAFAVEKGCPVNEQGAIEGAVKNGARACLEYLVENGFEVGEPFLVTASDDMSLFDRVELVVGCGVRIGWGQIVVAASLGDLRVLRICTLRGVDSGALRSTPPARVTYGIRI
jgi:hypothetical protein